ncbi:MAG: zf-HC2 domain-containing protein [Anaerolineales bacterium]
MNHQPFEDWLLGEQPLTSEQHRQLQAHLRACPACAALQEVTEALQAARPAAPAAGFGARFQVRLAAYQAAQRRRMAAGVLTLAAGVMAMLVFLLWPAAQAFLTSPSLSPASLFSNLVRVWISFQAYRDTLTTFLHVLNGLIPAHVRILATLLTLGGGWMWFISLTKVSRLPQGV